MSSPEEQILQKLCTVVFRENLFAYFILDNSGRIIGFNGCLADLDFKTPETGSHISDIVIFMEGILPFHGQTMEFSCIKTSSDISVDALLFKTTPGYGLIIWDSSKRDALLSKTQQEINELSLLIEKQKNRITHLSAPGTVPQDRFIEDLFAALNLAVLEMNVKGDFVLVGSAPEWLEYITQSSDILSGEAYKEDIFSFLGNFIQETKKRWAKNKKGPFKSGIWIEKDHSNQELLFEATALDIQHRKLLIISHDVLNPNQTQSIIQKGRNLALHYNTLQKSDQELKNMHDELEIRVKERTKDLEVANYKLANELAERKRLEKESEDVARQLRQSQKMEAIGTLAGGIAHDFNNVLAAIIGFTELSLSEIKKDSELKSRLEKVLHASDRAKDLVRQILTFSHQSDYEKQPLKLKQIVLETLNLLRASLPAFIEIRKNLISSGYILADQTQIHQVIMNVCTNAWHAMKDNGSGILTVTLTDKYITDEDCDNPVELSPGQYLVLSVEDTGCGIQPDLVEKIFDPYFSTKDKKNGTGLGLSVVHGIITKSKGAIAVDTTPEKGTTFRIFLPEFFPHKKEKATATPMMMGNNEHILFVDDEVLQAEMVHEFGQLLGYRITTCTDSQEALALFSQAPDEFDLVLTDMIMPKISGMVLSEKMISIRPDLPVILSSGYSSEIDKTSIKHIGISHFISKPFTMADFAKAIHAVLHRKSL